VADTEPHDALRHRCRVCGGPRVPIDDAEIVRSGREIPWLVRARRADLQRAGWRAGAGVVAGFGLLSLAVAILVIVLASPGLVGSIAALGASAVPFLVAMLGWARARALTTTRDETIARAWALAASDVLTHRGGELTADALAKILRTDVTHAERLLIDLHVADVARARVTEEGDLAYSVPADKVRLANDAVGETDQDEAAERARARAHVELPKR
jgi:hypothetical protein